MRGFGQKIGRTGITVPTSTVIQHRTLPRQKLSGAGGVPVEDWGAGAILLPRGLWIIIRHGRSVTYKRGSAHSLCQVGHAYCYDLWYIAMRSWGCGGRMCESLGVGYGLLAVYDDGFAVLFGLTGREGDD